MGGGHDRVYDQVATRALLSKLINDYVPEFARLRDAVEAKYGLELDSMKRGPRGK